MRRNVWENELAEEMKGDKWPTSADCDVHAVEPKGVAPQATTGGARPDRPTRARRPPTSPPPRMVSTSELAPEICAPAAARRRAAK